MAQIEDFIESPTEELLASYTKEQLLQIGDIYKVEIDKKRDKQTVKAILKSNLLEMNILKSGAEASVEPVLPVAAQECNWTFDQQKELLLLQMECEKIIQSAEIQKLKCNSEMQQMRLEMDKLIELERMKLEVEKLNLEREKLKLMKEGRMTTGLGLSGEGDSSFPDMTSSHSYDIVNNLRLVPKFNEDEPEIFFSLFERVADARSWSDAERTVLLQSVLTGKAQEAFSSLSVTDSLSYAKVKAAILKAYEMVPEAYRQRFRSARKEDSQTYLDFARDLVNNFNRWCAALKIDDYDNLRDLIILEQFKNSVPFRIATYLTEQQVKNVSDAATMADQFVLTHRTDWSRGRGFGQRENGNMDDVSRNVFFKSPQVEGKTSREFSDRNRPHYYYKKGNFRVEGQTPKNKGKQSNAKFAAAAAPVLSGISGQPLLDALEKNSGANDESYSSFITTGYVAETAEGDKIPVRILCDTGAQDSFIQASVLPFGEETFTGDLVLLKDMGLSVTSAPLHKIFLWSDLVEGQVCVGVRPALPVDGVDLILGNGLAGNRVWAHVPPPPVVSPVPVTVIGPDENEQDFPDVFAACAVTRAMAAGVSEESVMAEPVLSLADIPLSMSRVDLIKEQRADSSLTCLFDRTVSANEARDSALAYFIHDGVLV